MNVCDLHDCMNTVGEADVKTGLHSCYRQGPDTPINTQQMQKQQNSPSAMHTLSLVPGCARFIHAVAPVPRAFIITGVLSNFFFTLSPLSLQGFC